MTDLSRMKRHVGILNNTGVKCVVVFRKVPDDETHCLIVETERLPDMYHDNIINIVNSPEAQDTADLSAVLHRRTLSDGNNALQALHAKQFLRKVAVEQVSLVPFPNQKLPLGLLNAQMDGKMDEYNSNATQEAETALKETRANNPMADPSDPASLAQGLIVQAEMLEIEAKAKRDEAYSLDPSLVPETTNKRGRPTLTAEEKAASAEATKIKRRERDRKNAAEKRKAKKADEIQSAIDAKIVRDSQRES